MKQTHTLVQKFSGLLSLMPVKFKKRMMRNSALGVGISLLFLLTLTSRAQIVNTESFDGTTFAPTGWTNLTTSGTALWARVTSGANPTQAPHSGAGEAHFNAYSISSGAAALITPPFSLVSNTSGAAVSFWFYRDANTTYASTNDRIDVYYNTSANLTGATIMGTINRSTILTPTVAAAGWYLYSFTIPNTVTSSNAYLIFNAISSWGDNMFLDDVSWTSYPPACSGTPATPTLAISSPSGCPSAFNITALGYTTMPGTSYQWQASPTSTGTYTNLTGVTTPNFSGNPNTGTAFYRLVTTCANGGLTSTTSVVSYTTVNPGPCVCNAYGPSNATSTGDEEIVNVVVGTLSNPSSCTTLGPGPGSLINGYSNYAGFISAPTVCQGAATPFTVGVGTCGGYYTISLTIYMDLNQNGSFADVGEQLYVANGTIVSGNAVGTITIPITAAIGTTRMRIILSETGAAQGPTGTYTWGETEDYCVNVTAPPTIGLGANTGSICPGIPFTTTASGASTYSINGGPGLVSGSSISLTPIANTTYTIDGTSSSGCKALPATMANASITTLSSPSITITASNGASVCPSITSSLTLTGANSYTWTAPASNATLITVNPTTTVVYTVTATGTTVCNGVKNFTLNVYQNPTITVNSNTLCAGKVFTITPTMVPGGTPTYTYANGSNTLAPSTNTNINVTGTSTNGCIASAAVSSITVFTLPVVTVNSGTICNGSPFVIIPSGATNYTVLNGSNPVSPTVTTTYSVVGITTVGCLSLPAVSTVTVFNLPGVTVASTSTNVVVCNGSVLSLTASGASTYTWNNTTSGANYTSTPSADGSYFVVATDANGCQNVASVPYTVYPLPAVTLAATNTFVCSGSSATLTAGGSSSNYTWTGATSATNTAIVSPTISSIYGVAGTSSLGCTKTVTMAVTVNTIVLVASSNTVICQGTTIGLSANGANTYTWVPVNSPFNSISVTPSVTTTYTYHGVDAKQCHHMGMITVTVNANPIITATGSSTVICVGETATITAAGGTSYSWTAPTNTTGSTLVVNPNINTTYMVMGTDANGCSSNGTMVLKVDKCTGITKLENEISGLSIYPNPNNGEFTVELNNGLNKTIEVSDVTGRVILSAETQNDKTVMHLNEFANGVYYVKISSDKSVEVIKVIKN